MENEIGKEEPKLELAVSPVDKLIALENKTLRVGLYAFVSALAAEFMMSSFTKMTIVRRAQEIIESANMDEKEYEGLMQVLIGLIDKNGTKNEFMG